MQNAEKYCTRALPLIKKISGDGFITRAPKKLKPGKYKIIILYYKVSENARYLKFKKKQPLDTLGAIRD